MTGILLIAAVVCAGFCAGIARAKNRDGLGWFILGFLFSLIALIAIAGLPALPAGHPDDRSAAKPISAMDKAMISAAVLFLIAFTGVVTVLVR
jgi:hypothetical protein